ncbi:Kelch repeat-containing protein [Friedmanniella luteola]|uniref:Kelch repeat-containing protein n=1 Tax=Friedmanniella luteola TaxID=546871 RepID=UPI0012FE0216|nr:hypothetical protein [Friedmanniella luteola]
MTRRAAAALVACVLLPGCGSVADALPAEAPVFPAGVGAWSRLPPSPLSARHEAAGASLGGRFYVVGGWSDPPCPPAASCAAPARPPHRDGAAFDPATGRWRAIAPAPTPVGGVLQMTVVGQRLYVLTGSLDRADSPVSFLSYDPGADAWSTLPAPQLADPQLVAAGTKIVAVGCSDEQEAAVDAVFDPVTERWRRLPDDPLGPSYGRSAAWLGDQLLLTASDLVPSPGADGPPLTRLAVLDDGLTDWTLLPDSDIVGGHPTWVADRVVFPMTGSEDGGTIGTWGRHHANGAILDPATGTWTSLPEPPEGRSALDGVIGSVGDRTLVGGQLLQPRTRTWTRVPAAPWGQGYRTSQTIVTGPDGVFVWGGSDEADNLAEGYLLPL